MVVFLRFQNFPDDQMQHIVDYLDRGGPVMGLRTSTHAFKMSNGKFARFSTGYGGDDFKDGFGEQILGETWVGHYGRNHKQSSLLILEQDRLEHPILRGVKDVHVQCGGYKAFPLEGSTTLALGRILNGMNADAQPDTTKEEMPVAWVREYTGKSGKKGRVFTTTHGASEDILNPGFRRMLINAAFWCLGMEKAIKADGPIDFVGPYHPVTFSFGGHRKGVKPADIAGWESPILGAKEE
jgi:type 1 glutamine amidotransferase